MSGAAREDLLAGLLDPLGLSVWIRQEDGSFQSLARVPAWLKDLLKLDSETSVNLALASPFLENFLIDAEVFWRENRSGSLTSGPWMETADDGVEQPLEATATWSAGKKILLIQLLGGSYFEKARILQQARERILTLESLLRVDNALARAEAARGGVLRALPDAMFRLKRDGRFLNLVRAEEVGLGKAGTLSNWVDLSEVAPPDLRESLIARVERLLEQASPLAFEYQIESRGASRWMEARFVVSAPDEALVVVRDITEQRAAEAEIARKLNELRRTRDDLQAMLEALELAALTVESDGAVSYATRAAHELLGLENDSLIGQKLPRIEAFEPLEPGAVDQALAASTGEPLSLRWRSPGGPVLFLEMIVQEDPREPRRRIVFLRDVSEQWRLRQQLSTQPSSQNS